MIDVNLLIEKYEAKDYAVDYSQGTPIPWIYFDDFLPAKVLIKIQEEINDIPEHVWSKFTRNGSMMLECNNLKYCSNIRDLVLNLNSGEFIGWLESITGISRLIPDPHLIGAGLMRCGNNHSLKLHTDFNWNEQLHLNRSLSLILYFPKIWQEEWEGALEFWNFGKTKCLHRVFPMPNRLVIWNYHENFIHGHPNPIQCPPDIFRDGIRLFYFSSNGQPIQPPHRSLYWFDADRKQAYDKKENQ